MSECRTVGCDREATHTVIVNEPGRGYAEDPACTEHAENACGQLYVQTVRQWDGDET
jgi:hypothetical protein